jgi:EAL domain-containing protein (putative c-di-GMP-specific phosphodiesterase class I)
VQFNRPDFADTLMAALSRTGLDPHLLEIELTESCVLDDPAGTAARLETLRDLGISVSIDDFGTGYSSLANLCDLPCDTVKLDKSLLRQLEVEGDPSVVLRRVVDIGRALRKRIVVEGIETETQLALIEELSCDIAQGYLFSRPVPEDEFLAKSLSFSPAPA